MTAQARAAVFLGLSAAARYARPLIAPMRLYDVSLTRTQASGARSTALAEDGVTWVEYDADVARYTGPNQRLAIGGSRTNSNRNPRCEGASAPSTLPTYWAVDVAGGLTTDVVSTQVIGNVDTVTLRIYGTASGATYALRFEDTTQVVATPSSAWAAGFHARLDAAPAAPNSYSVRLIPRTAAGVGIAGGITSAAFAPDATLRRYIHGTTSIGSGVTTARVTGEYRSGITNGAYHDWTITLGWPTLEAGSFATMPILPAVGTPAAATRGADLVSVTLASLGIPASGACTILWSGMLPQAAPSTASQIIFQIDDGTNVNRVFARNTAGGSVIAVARTLAGATVASSAAGAMVAGTAFRCGCSIDGAGNVSISFNGAAPVSVAGGPSSGLTSMVLGGDRSGQQIFGETAFFRFSPRVATDEELRNLVEGMPI